MMTMPARAILSPCTGVCQLDADGLCKGCHRSGAEIADWVRMGEAERERYMDVVLPEREARRA